MNVALWTVACLLALTCLVAGLLQLVRSREQLIASGMVWGENFQPHTIKVVGWIGVVGATCLVVPPLVGFAPALAPLAALGLLPGFVWEGIFHARRGEIIDVLLSSVYAAAAAFVAWGRFGPYSF